VEEKRTEFTAVSTSILGQDQAIRGADANFCLPTTADEASLGRAAPAATESHNSTLMNTPSSSA